MNPFPGQEVGEDIDLADGSADGYRRETIPRLHVEDCLVAGKTDDTRPQDEVYPSESHLDRIWGSFRCCKMRARIENESRESSGLELDETRKTFCRSRMTDN
jgi:hypothetical protein